MGAFEAIKYLSGDTINELAKSSTGKELLKYGKNIVISFVDGICLADKVKKGVDLVVSILEVATKSGAVVRINESKVKQYTDLLAK